MSWIEFLKGEINAHRQQAGGDAVLYVEGHTDLEMIAGLVGGGGDLRSDGFEGVFVEGIFVVPLKDSRSGGARDVERRVELARDEKLGRFFGVVDGDGRPYGDIRSGLEGEGQMFSWPSYSIENMLALTDWPENWGEEPDWSEVLREYASLAALGLLRRKLAEDVVRGLYHQRTREPRPGERAPTPDDVVRGLDEDASRLRCDVNLVDMFEKSLERVEGSIERDLREGHAVINGKWLVEHMAPRRTGLSGDECRSAWSAWIGRRGGSPTVIDFWKRIAAGPS
jgi:hypothetical protein